MVRHYRVFYAGESYFNVSQIQIYVVIKPSSIYVLRHPGDQIDLVDGQMRMTKLSEHFIFVLDGTTTIYIYSLQTMELLFKKHLEIDGFNF